ncbi:hypothetical protein QUF88_24845 [Bacillus sp. DX1.1]|uniref:hypothetical protein n=1 Tax=unclassified Bacillus (in: firmicutes) TaxID=185979 RepID=UPI0025703157|nr:MULTISPECIES: hypothetical protein [unclassified Bacillus (in: firmicutes)]MDM5156941.1 hypothetical protein [Bacillus sp. DX1.1]WJE81182.1 hypothetical protein QRE67_22385 [Bacillus sp. DX3.1]
MKVLKSSKVLLILLALNILSFFPLIEELHDASDPNFGVISLVLIPTLALVSLIIIYRQRKNRNVSKGLLRLWFVINILLLFFPFALMILMGLVILG